QHPEVERIQGEGHQDESRHAVEDDRHAEGQSVHRSASIPPRAHAVHQGKPRWPHREYYVGVRAKRATARPPKMILAVQAATIGGRSSTRPSERAPEFTTQYEIAITTASAPPIRRPPRGQRAAHATARTASTKLINGNDTFE